MFSISQGGCSFCQCTILVIDTDTDWPPSHHRNDSGSDTANMMSFQSFNPMSPSHAPPPYIQPPTLPSHTNDSLTLYPIFTPLQKNLPPLYVPINFSASCTLNSLSLQVQKIALPLQFCTIFFHFCQGRCIWPVKTLWSMMDISPARAISRTTTVMAWLYKCLHTRDKGETREGVGHSLATRWLSGHTRRTSVRPRLPGLYNISDMQAPLLPTTDRL